MKGMTHFQANMQKDDDLIRALNMPWVSGEEAEDNQGEDLQSDDRDGYKKSPRQCESEAERYEKEVSF